MTRTTEEVEAIFDRRRRAWLGGDVDAYLSFFDPDIEMIMPTRTIVGIDAYLALVRASYEIMAPERFEIPRLIHDGDTVMTEFWNEARHRATGRTLHWEGMAVCELRGDRIAWWREYWDPRQLQPSEEPSLG